MNAGDKYKTEYLIERVLKVWYFDAVLARLCVVLIVAGRCCLLNARALTSCMPSKFWRRKSWFRMMMLTAFWWRNVCWLWATNHRFSLHCIPAFRQWSAINSSSLIKCNVIFLECPKGLNRKYVFISGSRKDSWKRNILTTSEVRQSLCREISIIQMDIVNFWAPSFQ